MCRMSPAIHTCFNTCAVSAATARGVTRLPRQQTLWLLAALLLRSLLLPYCWTCSFLCPSTTPVHQAPVCVGEHAVRRLSTANNTSTRNITGPDLSRAPSQADAVQERCCCEDCKDAEGDERCSAVVHGVGAVPAAVGTAAAAVVPVAPHPRSERDGLVVAIRDFQADDMFWRAEEAEVVEIEGRLVLHTSRSQRSDHMPYCASCRDVPECRTVEHHAPMPPCTGTADKCRHWPHGIRSACAQGRCGATSKPARHDAFNLLPRRPKNCPMRPVTQFHSPSANTQQWGQGPCGAWPQLRTVPSGSRRR
jgi:hypothetical protein